MIAAALQSLTDWLDGKTTINPLAITSPGSQLVVGKSVNDYVNTPEWRVVGHAAPPPIRFIANPLSDERCAKWEAPPGYPALYIVVDGPAGVEAEVATHNRDARSVLVAIRYLVEKGNAFKGQRDWVYTAEAIQKSLRQYWADDQDGRSARTLLSKHIRNGQSAAYGPWYEEVGEALAVGVYSLEMYVRDNAP